MAPTSWHRQPWSCWSKQTHILMMKKTNLTTTRMFFKVWCRNTNSNPSRNIIKLSYNALGWVLSNTASLKRKVNMDGLHPRDNTIGKNNNGIPVYNKGRLRLTYNATWKWLSHLACRYVVLYIYEPTTFMNVKILRFYTYNVQCKMYNDKIIMQHRTYIYI